MNLLFSRFYSEITYNNVWWSSFCEQYNIGFVNMCGSIMAFISPLLFVGMTRYDDLL